MTYAFCQCKIHCARYNPTTNTYTGGELVTRTTAAQHRADENRSIAHGIFSSNITASILGNNSLLSPQSLYDPLRGSPLERDSFDQESLTLEHELDDRCVWTPNNHRLVFALDPDPDEAFQPPMPYNGYVPNSGACALDPSHPSNLAFIENENRLFEILARLESMGGSDDLRGRLTEMIWSGLERMWSHKESEWDRQRCRAVALADGYGVVDNGQCVIRLETEHV